MLLRFSVENFLSFDKNVEFSMFPGKVRTKENHLIHSKNMNILRFSALYGANAAGKSNLVTAMAFSQSIIMRGVEWSSKDKYFKLKKSNKDKKTSFEYEIFINKKCYAYGFNINLAEKKIIGEWLYEVREKDDKLIFERDLENKTFKSEIRFDEDINKKRFEIYSEDNRFNEKILLLSELNRNKEEIYKSTSEFDIFKDVYEWFKKILDINYANAPITNFQYFLKGDTEFNQNITKILDMFGTGITGFKLINSRIEDIRLPKEALDDVIKKIKEGKKSVINIRTHNEFHNIKILEDDNVEIKTIVFEHGNLGCEFFFEDESDGTRRLLDLIEVLINSENKVFIIDEIDRSLHPNLTYKFIELFLNFSVNVNSQLIITTHEDRVLDLNLLRRDEVWFAEKNDDGATNLYSLENYQPRFDKKTCKAYLEGRYGGIPKFKAIDFEIFKENFK